MDYLLVINTLLLLVLITQRQIKLSTIRSIETKMSTQESRLQSVIGKLTKIQAGIDTLQQQVADLKANNPDLEDELSAIESTIDSMDADVNPAAPAPPEEPPV